MLSFHHQDELAFANRGSSKPSTPINQGNLSKTGVSVSSSNGKSNTNTSMSSQDGTSSSNTSNYSSNTQPSTPLFPHNTPSLGQGVVTSSPLSAALSDIVMESVDTPPQEEVTSGGLSKNLDWKSGKPESSKNVGAEQEEEEEEQFSQKALMTALKPEGDAFIFNLYLYSIRPSVFNFKLLLKNIHLILESLLNYSGGLLKTKTVLLDGTESVEKSEVQAIIESTPELDMDFDGCRGTRYETDFG